MTSNEVMAPSPQPASSPLDIDSLVFDADLDSGTSSPASSRVSTPTKTSLSEDEEAATKQFLRHVNGWRSARGYTSLSWSSAVKFLMARKFNVERSLVLYQQHELMRLREGLTVFDSSVSPLKEELLTGKFTVLSPRDKNGAALALFHAHKHDPTFVTHRTTLQGVVYQLDVAMEDPATQRAGIVFIYNMSGSKYANFDYDLSQKMLTLLKGCYPARLKKVLIVTAPLWFKAPFKVLRLFVREKLRDRVFTVSLPQLLLHVPAENLPIELGGLLNHDHEKWIDTCETITLNRSGELVTMSSSQPTTPIRSHPTLEQLESLPVIRCLNGMAPPIVEVSEPMPQPPENEDDHIESAENNVPVMTTSLTEDVVEVVERTVVSTATNGYMKDVDLADEERDESSSENEAGLSLSEFIEHVRLKGRRGLYEEYAEIKSRPPTGTFHHARALQNQAKNRYTDVLCYDHSRVLLDQDTNETCSDYINANFVDGYKQPRAFIFSQGPLPKTFSDFWQMVWEQKVLVIVMTTKAIERHRTKCGQYWPDDVGATLVAGNYRINSEEVENCGDDFIVTHLLLEQIDSGQTRPICHFQFVSWPDYGVPDSALSMLHFLQRVREKQAEMRLENIPAETLKENPGPPIVVHCSAGIGRTGTFATLDIAIRKFEDVGKVDIRSTVEAIRSQRAFSIQMPDQYVFCHLAFLEYVLNMEYIDEIDLTGFDDDCDSE